MTILTEKAYAKVNLTLDVLGKRPDGYHELYSVMQGISLADDVELSLDTGKPWALECGQPGIPQDGRNLAWRAAEQFLSATGRSLDGLTIRICKRIPSQAGLGGGSADAAAVLRGLNRYFGSPLSILELAQLGAAVGSDVPFCVLCGTALAQGRGERLTPMPRIPDCCFVICKPAFSASTPELYRRLDQVPVPRRPDHEAMDQAIRRGDLEGITGNLCNVFEYAVSPDHPELEQIKELFRANGAWGVAMSGSGSAIFGITQTLEQARPIQEALNRAGLQNFLAKPV